MKPSTWVVAAAVVASLALPAAAQIGSTKELPARVELHAVKSLWLSDQQFLSGDPNGKAIFGYTDACVKLDPLVGGDREATEAALKEVTAFVSTIFALN